MKLDDLRKQFTSAVEPADNPTLINYPRLPSDWPKIRKHESGPAFSHDYWEYNGSYYPTQLAAAVAQKAYHDEWKRRHPQINRFEQTAQVCECPKCGFVLYHKGLDGCEQCFLDGLPFRTPVSGICTVSLEQLRDMAVVKSMDLERSVSAHHAGRWDKALAPIDSIPVDHPIPRGKEPSKRELGLKSRERREARERILDSFETVKPEPLLRVDKPFTEDELRKLRAIQLKRRGG